MNRYMVGTFAFAAALLLAAGDSVAGQGGAQVEYRHGRIGVGLALGSLPLPVGVGPHGGVSHGWIVADWGPLRIRVASRRPSWVKSTLHRQELRYLLGRETVRRIEWHARQLGLRGPTRGKWFRANRSTMVLEVSVNRVPVAELYDYRNDGRIDELLLVRPHYPLRPGVSRYDRFGDWNKRYGDDEDDWDDWYDDRNGNRRGRGR